MYKRTDYEPKPDRAPYFWVDTRVGRFCFARRLASQTRSWGLELQGQHSQARALMVEARDIAESDPQGASERAALAQAVYEAALGLYIARHWVDEAHVLESRLAYRAGKLHPSNAWDSHLPSLESTTLRYGWLAACELAEWDLTEDEISGMVEAIASGKSSLPDPEDIEETATFSEPPRASGISA